MMKRAYILFVNLLVLYNISLAQNYYFIDDIHKKEGVFVKDINELNLQTGTSQKIFDDVDAIVLSDMSKIILNTIPDQKICIYDTKSTMIDTLDFFGKYDLYDAYLVPYDNGKAIFIRGARDNAEWINKKDRVRVQTKVLIDKDTYSIIDSTAHFVNDRNSVISKNGRTYYLLKKDDNGIYFESYSTNTGELISERITIEGIDITKVENTPYIEDCRNGIIFFGFINRSEKQTHRILYDITQGKIINYTISSFGPPYGEFLTQNGDMVYHDPEAGYIYILEKETAKLKQRIKVEPILEPWYDGEPTYSLFTLGDSLYFLPQRPENPKYKPPYNFDNIVQADVTKVQSNTSLIDMLTDDVEESYRKGWVTNQTTLEKYQNYFNDVHTYLQQSNMSGARSTLQTVIQNLEQDNGTVLTTEVYNLLHYNTESLLGRLPEVQPSGLPVKLINSQGQLLQGGTLKYYDGGWKEATDHGDGTFTVDTEKSTISLRMTFAYASQDMSNVPVGSDTVTFQTLNAQIELQNSQNQLIDEGMVKYYAGGWRDFGTTKNGIANRELLPNSYNFRITYGFASNDKSQDISVNSTVIFQTINAQVELQDSQNQLMDEGTVKYYAGGWRDFGVTSGGVASKELLPNSYNFRMTYGFASNDKSQDISVNSTVIFQTINAQVELRDSQNQLMDEGTVKYYAGGWRDFGVTSGGVVYKELLPNSYNFRMTYGYASNDKTQDISSNPTVVFQTTSVQVELRDSQNQLMDEGTVKYYAGGWRDFGATTNGIASKELLPNSYNFRMTYGFASNDKSQDISTNPAVVFQTLNAQVELQNSQNQLIDEGTVKYYSGG